MEPVEWVLIAAAAVFLVGAVLFLIGIFTPTEVRRAETGFWDVVLELVLKPWRILFPPAGKPAPPTYQRRTAGGILLMAVAIVLAVGALAASSLLDGDSAEPDPTESTSPTTTETP